MKEIHIFEAEDGSRFDLRENCEQYEKLCAEVKRIMSPLKEVDISGPKFYQHHISTVQNVAKAFTELAVKRFAPDRVNEEWHPQGIIQRFVDDSSAACLRRASGRINCIDLDTGREYEQPYYRLHPNEATQPV